MLHTLTFEVEGELLGEAQSAEYLIRGQLRPPESIAFFCRKCCRIWAKITGPDREDFSILTVPCQQHEPKELFQVYGSIWISWVPEYLAVLPRKVLERELSLHVAHFERFQNDPRY